MTRANLPRRHSEPKAPDTCRGPRECLNLRSLKKKKVTLIQPGLYLSSYQCNHKLYIYFLFMKKGVHEGDEGTEALEVTCSGLVTVEPMWPEIYVATKLVATSLLSFLESSGISFLPLFLRVRFPWGKKSCNCVSDEPKGRKDFPFVWWLSVGSLEPRCLGIELGHSLKSLSLGFPMYKMGMMRSLPWGYWEAYK